MATPKSKSGARAMSTTLKKASSKKAARKPAATKAAQMKMEPKKTTPKKTAPKNTAQAAQKLAPGQASGEAASRLIDQRIADLGGWRGQTLARMRALILEADPEIIEEWKWMGTPIWSHHGIVTTGEAYTKVVKLTFAKGASLPDPARLFNSSLEGNTRRAIDIPEGAAVDAAAFKALVKAAVALNAQLKKR